MDYSYRAAVAYYALGMNLPQYAVYASASADSDGRPLDGRNSYVLHFDQAMLPPVDAFWSVTVYDSDGYFIPNPLDRQARGDRDPLHVNDDGSIDIYIQAASRGESKESPDRSRRPRCRSGIPPTHSPTDHSLGRFAEQPASQPVVCGPESGPEF